MGFPVEAGPETPGHVGWSPQHPDVMLNRARLEGILSSGVARFWAPVTLAMQEFPQSPQHFARASQLHSLLRIEDYRRRRSQLQPELLEFDPSVMLTTHPPAPIAAELAADRTSRA